MLQQHVQPVSVPAKKYTTDDEQVIVLDPLGGPVQLCRPTDSVAIVEPEGTVFITAPKDRVVVQFPGHRIVAIETDGSVSAYADELDELD